jgi:hypothetical protein
MKFYHCNSVALWLRPPKAEDLDPVLVRREAWAHVESCRYFPCPLGSPKSSRVQPELSLIHLLTAPKHYYICWIHSYRLPTPLFAVCVVFMWQWPVNPSQPDSLSLQQGYKNLSIFLKITENLWNRIGPNLKTSNLLFTDSFF